MQYILKITGRHDKDDVEFKYGLLTWTTDSTSGFAKCRGVTADDWNKGGSHCRTDVSHGIWRAEMTWEVCCALTFGYSRGSSSASSPAKL